MNSVNLIIIYNKMSSISDCSEMPPTSFLPQSSLTDSDRIYMLERRSEGTLSVLTDLLRHVHSFCSAFKEMKGDELATPEQLRNRSLQTLGSAERIFKDIHKSASRVMRNTDCPMCLSKEEKDCGKIVTVMNPTIPMRGALRHE